MKNIATIALVFLLGFQLHAQELTTVSNSDYGFEIGVPKGWAQLPTDENSTVVFIAENKNENALGENLNINLFQFNDVSLEDVSNHYYGIVSQETDFELLAVADVTFAQRDYKLIVENHNASGDLITHYTLITIDKGLVFMLTLGCLEQNYEDFQPTFEAIAESLKY